MPQDDIGTDDVQSTIDVDALASAFVEKFKASGKSDGESAAIKAVGTLLADNRKYRGRLREMKEQLVDLEKQVPKDGHVLVPQTEYDALAEAMKEGESIKDFVKRAERGFESEAKAEVLQKDLTLKEAASLTGFNLDILRDRSQGLAVEIEGEGTEQRAVITDDEGKRHDLVEYAEQKWSAYMPALVGSDSAAQGPSFPHQPSTTHRKPNVSRVASVEDVKRRKDADSRYVAI